MSIEKPDPPIVRVAALNWQVRPVADRGAFTERVGQWLDVAAGYGCDLLLLPELVTLELLAVTPGLPGDQAIAALSRHTEGLIEELSRLAQASRVNLVLGSHPHARTGPDGRTLIRNSAFVLLRDGSIHRRDKLHPTPSERSTWAITGGDAAEVAPIASDCGTLGVAICYDAEFPEVCRSLALAGTEILLVPFCTDTRAGFLRVWRCAAARAVENQCYVVASGTVGRLAGVANHDIQYAQSGVLTPCDFGFPPEGIAAQAEANVEMLVFADLDRELLQHLRRAGSVRTLADRRPELYRQLLR